MHLYEDAQVAETTDFIILKLIIWDPRNMLFKGYKSTDTKKIC